MAKKSISSQLIERAVMSMIYAAYGIAINCFLMFFDGDYKPWARIVNLIPLCIIILTMISLFVLSLKKNYNMESIYNICLGFGLSSGVSAFTLAFLIDAFVGAYFSVFAAVPILLFVIDKFIWWGLNRQNNEQEDKHFRLPNNTFFFTMALAIVVTISIVYIGVEATIRGNIYNFTVCAFLLPMIIIPLIYLITKRNKPLSYIAFLVGTCIGLSGLLGCTPILNYSIMGGIGAVIICIIINYLCMTSLIFFFIMQCTLVQKRNCMEVKNS